MLRMPATSGITGRIGPTKRPMATLLAPWRAKKRSPLAIHSGLRRNGQARLMSSWKMRPSRKLTPSPATAPAKAASRHSGRPSAPEPATKAAAPSSATPGTAMPRIAKDSAKETSAIAPPPRRDAAPASAGRRSHRRRQRASVTVFLRGLRAPAVASAPGWRVRRAGGGDIMPRLRAEAGAPHLHSEPDIAWISGRIWPTSAAKRGPPRG